MPRAPWVRTTFSVTLGALTVALIGVVNRRAERRAFWVGFALCGWAYMAFSSGPWFAIDVRPRLVTTRLLQWAYPRLIPEARQSSGFRSSTRTFIVPAPELGDGLTADSLGADAVDVAIKGEGETPPSLLAEGVEVAGTSTTGGKLTKVTLRTNPAQVARLTQALADQVKFVLRRHQPSPFAAIWSSPPVEVDDFVGVGHSLYGLLCAWVGGAVGRYFYATRDPPP